MRLPLLALAALTLLRLIFCATLPLTPDEAYYFAWSAHLQTGYFDHPPMIAYLMHFGVLAAGPSPFGIRLLAPLLAAAGTLLIYDAGEQFFPDRQAGLVAAALLNATLLVGAGAVIFTPDTPLLLFWTAGIAAFARWQRSGDPRWWGGIGIAVGLALLSKYTAILFAAAIFLHLVSSRAGRAGLRTPWPWVAAVLALLIFSPDIVWNAAHHWVSYVKQGSRVAGFDARRTAQFLGEFVAGQFFLATPMIAVLIVAGLVRLGRQNSGHVLIWLTAVPAAVFLEHVFSGRVEANWAAIFYPSACLAAAALPISVLRRFLRPALALGVLFTAAAYAQALTAFAPLPANDDPTAIQLGGFAGLAAAAASYHPAYLTSDDYGTAAILAFYVPRSIPVAGYVPGWWDVRWATFALPAAPGGEGILITHRLDAYCPQQLGTIVRRRSGQVIETYRVCAFTPPGPGVLLPRP
jgi:4-amino-4-deoxy-L-arabinose transferase-like glycosyltransferase